MEFGVIHSLRHLLEKILSYGRLSFSGNVRICKGQKQALLNLDCHIVSIFTSAVTTKETHQCTTANYFP